MKKAAGFDLDAYAFVVRKLTEEEGGGFMVEYPDVPLCRSDGATAEEAIANGREALEGCLRCYVEDGRAAQCYSGTFRVRMSKGLHAEVAAQAKEEGVSLNLFVVEAVAGRLKRPARGRGVGRRRG